MLGPVSAQDPQRPIVVKKHVAGAREQKLAIGQSDQNEQSKDEDAEEDVNAERNGSEGIWFKSERLTSAQAVPMATDARS